MTSVACRNAPLCRDQTKPRWRQRDTSDAGRHLPASFAGGGIVEPLPGLFVGPARDGDARTRRSGGIGTNDHVLARAWMGRRLGVPARLCAGGAQSAINRPAISKERIALLEPWSHGACAARTAPTQCAATSRSITRTGHSACGRANGKIPLRSRNGSPPPQSHIAQKAAVAAPYPALTRAVVHRPIDPRRLPRGK